MEIKLEKVGLEEKIALLEATATELDLDLDLARLDSDIEYEVAHHRIENEVFLAGPVRFSLVFTCARCLTEYRREFTVLLHLVLQLVTDEQVEAFEETDDEFIIWPESRETYPLDRHLRDLVSLEVPLKPLCKEDCAGLCSQCGANLNETSCDCGAQDADPRWQGLKQFLSDN